MITIVLFGGLGNQMFQYAAGRALAIRLNTEIRIDLSLFYQKTKSKRTYRPYALSVFEEQGNCSHRKSSSFFIRLFYKLQKFPKLLRFARLFIRGVIFRDGHPLNFNSAICELKNNVILMGYFQNELYFKENEKLIRQSFQFPLLPMGELRTIGQQICSCESISIHVRRGDYITNAKAANNFASLSMEYYEWAMNYIEAKVKNPHYFLFSDDQDWVKANFILVKEKMTIVNLSGYSDYRDMQLMSMCKHNITANSSFSWWGAWLNSNPDKIVIAPNEWFRKTEINETIKDHIPQSWIQYKF